MCWAAMALPEPPRLARHEGGPTGLLAAELAVLADLISPMLVPVQPHSVACTIHLLGRSGVAFLPRPGCLARQG